MILTKEQIDKINKLAPNKWQENEQGVFTQPYGIPVHIKEPVIYMRWKTGGVAGGSYHENSCPKRYEVYDDKPKFEVLDLVLNEIMPTISYLKYREIEKLIHTNSETEYEYYGNSTDYDIEYIILSDLFKSLENHL